LYTLNQLFDEQAQVQFFSKKKKESIFDKDPSFTQHMIMQNHHLKNKVSEKERIAKSLNL